MHFAPCGEHFDPGIKSRNRVEEKAKSRQREHMKQPPYHNLVDISRLAIVFDSVTRLEATLRKIVTGDDFDVAWVDNKFRNPSCLGYRDVNIGIRSDANRWYPDESDENVRKHLTELQLLLRDIYEVKQGPGHKYYESIRSTLAKCGVQGYHNDGIVRLILQILDSTDGRVARNTALELTHILSHEFGLESLASISQIQNGTHLSALEPLLQKSPKDILQSVVELWAEVLPHDAQLQRSFAESGGLWEIQKVAGFIPGIYGEFLRDVDINNLYPPAIVEKAKTLQRNEFALVAAASELTAGEEGAAKKKCYFGFID
jgi:hypothetical protein